MTKPLIVCGVGVVCLCALVVLRQVKKEYAAVAGAVCTCLFIPVGLLALKDYFSYFTALAESSAYGGYFELLFKAVGIAAMSNAVSSLCRDCGEASLGEKLEFCSRCSILALSLPVTKDLLSYALSLL